MSIKNNSCVPRHLGIIIDGNRRWAKQNKLPLIEGHRQGSENVKKIGDWCRKKGVKILTLFVFSTENWYRPRNEVKYLMKLLADSLSGDNIGKLHKDGIKVKIIGQRERLPKDLQEKIKEAEKLTGNNKKGILNLALSYGGRVEIVEAVKKILRKKISFSKISEKIFEKNLWTEDEPPLDLIIRTGGEKRISNFLIWQAAYSELYFSDKYWPDFNKKDLEAAFRDYAGRNRRFGH